jgi:hypothetical protein
MLARAKSWRGATTLGHDVLLSVCVLDAGVPHCERWIDADIEWFDETDWRLVAVPPR